jgi:RNA 2',3'-cyclic 3'-phosphodiesterase
VAASGERERLRLFVALDLPQDAREALVAWRTGVMSLFRELRPVADNALHVTLCFLGSLPASGVKQIADACGAALDGAPGPDLGLGAGLWLPPRRPRVVGVRLGDPSGVLAQIQDSVSRALADGGWYRPEKRLFLPHVTVARVPTRVRIRTAELPPLPRLTFNAPSVTLYRSRLQRSGARYEPLARIGLSRQGTAG